MGTLSDIIRKHQPDYPTIKTKIVIDIIYALNKQNIIVVEACVNLNRLSIENDCYLLKYKDEGFFMRFNDIGYPVINSITLKNFDEISIRLETKIIKLRKKANDFLRAFGYLNNDDNKLIKISSEKLSHYGQEFLDLSKLFRKDRIKSILDER